MASSAKFDLSSSSPSRPLYTSGKRGSHTAASMDRSAGFRDNMDNPILSSLPSISRSSTMNVSQGDVTNFLQCLRFDLKSMAAEYKCNRYGDFKRLANAALCAPDNSPSGLFRGKLPFYSPEDLKRLKSGLRESTIKARERVKTFSDVLSVINKCFPSIPSRKRSRLDAFSGVTVGKMGNQSHTLTGAFDIEQQKVEERGKNVIPNKRTRTSMADVRPNTPARSSGCVDRDREVLRLPNINTLEGVDEPLPIVADGWEKVKMKKKRTVVKADWAPSTSSTLAKPTDGSKEPKQGMHPRSLADSRSRLNDPHEFRSRAANGSMRSSIPRPEKENTSVMHYKRDQTTKLEQERTNVRAFNKVNVRQDFISGTPSSTTKLHAVARGPRSGSNAVPKLTHVQSPTISNGSNPSLINSTNRKRGLSTRSSSPPVAQWAERRPQKISRTARRTNLIPVLSTNAEVPPLSNVVISEKGHGFAKRFPASSPKQFKSKGDHNIQSSTLSESEDSGAAEIRSRDNLKLEEIEDKDGLNVQKMSSLIFPTRKNKFMKEKHHRTGRGFASARSEKQLRTGRVGDKPESKIGRPPTRKLSGRQAYARQKHSAIAVATDFLDDGHGELLAAANAVINPVYTSSSPFWRQIDLLFGFMSDASVTYLKQEGNIRSTANITSPIDNCDTENGTQRDCQYSENLTSGTSPRGITLCQRLLAALISEEDDNDELSYNIYGSAFVPETDIIGGRFSSSYRIDSTLRSCNQVAPSQSDNYVMSMVDSAVATGFDHRCNGLLSDSGKIHATTSSQHQYGNKSVDERLLIEIHSLGLYPEHVPDLVHSGDEDISKDINRLEEKHHQQVFRKKNLLDKLLKSTEEAMALQEKEFERLSLERLTGMAYQKYMSCCSRSTSSKMAKQAALDFVKRTLDRCHQFELTGQSCFSEPLFKDTFHSGLSHLNHTEVDDVIDGQSRKESGTFVEDFSGTQVSPMSNNHEMYLSEPIVGKDDVWSSRGKKRELYLDDVAAGSPCTSSGIPSGVGRVIINSVKGKRSERDPRNGGPKVGRPAKIKAKQKQKTTQLSSSVNGILGNFSDQQRAKSSFDLKPTINEEDQSMLLENFEEPLDLSHLQLPEMVEFGGQGEDIGSWLNIDDDILQHDDDDFMGLEIPMDDLTDLNMMV